MKIQEASEDFTQVPRQINYEENTSTGEEYRKTGENACRAHHMGL